MIAIGSRSSRNKRDAPEQWQPDLAFEKRREVPLFS